MERDRTTTIWEELARPFNDADVSSIRDGRRNYRYISAAICRRRLNDVVGHPGWQCKVSYGDGAAVCHLTITDPAGDSTTRGAIGHDEPDRPADDAAFSHVCELFGIGSYLAIDDARYARPDVSATPASAPPPPRDERTPARDDREPERDDDRPARDDRPAQRDSYGEREREPVRDRGGRREQGRGPRQGAGWGAGPRPGGGVYAWVMDQEETHPNGRGLKDYLVNWGKRIRMPKSFKEYTERDIHAMVDEARAYLAQEVTSDR